MAAPALAPLLLLLAVGRAGAVSGKAVEVLRCSAVGGPACGGDAADLAAAAAFGEAPWGARLPRPKPVRQRRYVSEEVVLAEGGGERQRRSIAAMGDDAQAVTFDEALVMDASRAVAASSRSTQAANASEASGAAQGPGVFGLDEGWGLSAPPPSEADEAPLHTDTVTLELRLHNISVEQMHSKSNNSVAEILGPLEEALGSAEGQAPGKVRVLGIFGRYTTRRWRLEEVARPPRIGEEVVVVFEASTAHAESVEQVIDRLRAGLSPPAPGSALAASPALVAALGHFSIGLHTPAKHKARTGTERESVKALRTMALPILLSALFTGALIWLASC